MDYKDLNCYRVKVTATTVIYVPATSKDKAIREAVYSVSGPGYFHAWKVIRVKVKLPRTIQLPSWLKRSKRKASEEQVERKYDWLMPQRSI